MTSVHRGAAIFAGIFSLFQALIWVVLSVLFVAAYTCHWDVPTDETKRQNAYSILYVTYFKGPCHKNPSPQAQRTNTFMVIYAVISACWIPSSVLLMVAAIIRVSGKVGSLCYVPWLIVTTIIIVIDLVGTVLYGIDIGRTLTLDDYNEYISPLHVRGADGMTALPAIEMTLFFSRVVVLWIINFILLIVIIQAQVAVCQPQVNRNTKKENQQTTKSEGNTRNDVTKRWDVFTPNPTTENTQDEEAERRNQRSTLGEQTNSSSGTTYSSSPESTLPSQARIFAVDGTPVSGLSVQQEEPIGDANKEVPIKKPMIGWSYTQGITEIKNIRRNSIEGMEKPPVPVPDYTMHISAERRHPTILQGLSGSQQITERNNAGEVPKGRGGVGVY